MGTETETIPEWEQLSIPRQDYAEPDDAGVEHLVPPEELEEEDGS